MFSYQDSRKLYQRVGEKKSKKSPCLAINARNVGTHKGQHLHTNAPMVAIACGDNCPDLLNLYLQVYNLKRI